jgi:hypothetical protein
MSVFKEMAEYYRMGLLHGFVDIGDISSWADKIILESKIDIPDWALELTFAKTRSVNEVISTLASIAGTYDKRQLIWKVLNQIFFCYIRNGLTVHSAVKASFAIVRNEIDLFSGKKVPEELEQLYLDLMRLDDAVDLEKEALHGSEEDTRSGYLEFIKDYNLGKNNPQ